MKMLIKTLKFFPPCKDGDARIGLGFLVLPLSILVLKELICISKNLNTILIIKLLIVLWYCLIKHFGQYII